MSMIGTLRNKELARCVIQYTHLFKAIKKDPLGAIKEFETQYGIKLGKIGPEDIEILSQLTDDEFDPFGSFCESN